MMRGKRKKWEREGGRGKGNGEGGKGTVD